MSNVYAVYMVIHVLFKIIIYLVGANVLLLNVSNAASGAGHSLWSCSGIGRVHTVNFTRRAYRSRTVRGHCTLRLLRRVRPVGPTLRPLTRNV